MPQWVASLHARHRANARQRLWCLVLGSAAAAVSRGVDLRWVNCNTMGGRGFVMRAVYAAQYDEPSALRPWLGSGAAAR